MLEIARQCACTEFSNSWPLNVSVMPFVILIVFVTWLTCFLCFVLLQPQAVSKVVVLGFRGSLKACKCISDKGVFMYL